MQVFNGCLFDVTDEDINEDGTFTKWDGITKIGNQAFGEYGQTNKFPQNLNNKSLSLLEINIPDSIKSIGDMSFYNCKLLKKINISNGIENIEKRAFCGCKSLEEINIANGNVKIGKRAFDYCPSLTKITIGNETKTVELIDEKCMEVLAAGNLDGYVILKCRYFDTGNDCFAAKKDGYTISGKTVRKAIRTLDYVLQLDEKKRKRQAIDSKTSISPQ